MKLKVKNRYFPVVIFILALLCGSMSAFAGEVEFELVRVKAEKKGTDEYGPAVPLCKLSNGGSFELKRTGKKINIRAHFQQNSSIHRVQFKLDGEIIGVDNKPPWTLAGDRGYDQIGVWKPSVGSHNLEVVASDKNGNRVVEKQLNFQVSDGLPHESPAYFKPQLADMTNLTNVSGTFFFTAGEEGQRMLWKSDGTEKGSVKIKSISRGWRVSRLTDVNGTLYFIAEYLNTGSMQLWKSNGTKKGTVKVKDKILAVDSLFNVSGRLFFTSQDENGGRWLWTCDGTKEGTKRLKQIHSTLGPFIAVGKKLYFSTRDKSGSVWLWKSDGTQEGTENFKKINSERVVKGLEINNIFYFFSFSKKDGKRSQLWKTDGTPKGTIKIKNFEKNVLFFTRLNNSLFFTCSGGGGSELWKSNGSAKGTTKIQNFEGRITNLISVNKHIYFSLKKNMVWKSDGSKEGTKVLFKELEHPVKKLLNLGENLVVYTFEDKYHEDIKDFLYSSDIFLTDGTKEGTDTVYSTDFLWVDFPVSVGSTLYFKIFSLGFLKFESCCYSQ